MLAIHNSGVNAGRQFYARVQQRGKERPTAKKARNSIDIPLPVEVELPAKTAPRIPKNRTKNYSSFDRPCTCAITI